MTYSEIIININNKNVDKVFNYKIPENLKNDIKLGMRVIVPFGKNNKKYEGYVVGFTDTIDFDENKVKNIIKLVDKYSVISTKMIELAKWMQNKYYTTLSNCIQCIVPKITNDKIDKFVYINNEINNIDEIIENIIKKNNSQSKVLQYLKLNNGQKLNNIVKHLNISLSPINTLKKNNIIKILDVEIKRNIFNISDFEKSDDLILNDEQKFAVDFIKKRFNKKDKKPILIHGVTGSGKTEVYLQVIHEVIKQGKQAIVLVPEISLTPQTVERFISRFGNKVTVTHSRLSDSERFDQWKKAKSGEISIMIGPRSAVFAPFQNLGIIIIDEEHENSYKSEITPKYDAREVAFKIGQLNDCLVVLGSATPSIQSYYNAQNDNFELINIKNRVNLLFPKINVIDMRKELENGNRSIFSIELMNAIKKNIDNKKQTILFLNRRGYSTFVSCRKCGFVMKCNNCNVNYTYHREQNSLICHYCGEHKLVPNICPQCGSKYIKHFGVGTEKVEQEVHKYFSNAKTLRMDLDTTRKKNSYTEILNNFKNRNADILIGTQMIAKGLDFPNVTLVGVIAADLSLNISDYHNAEYTFQLLSQVSGRAGRAKERGTVFIQTYQPEHYSIVYAQDNDYVGFYEEEIIIRQNNIIPPFCHIFFIMFSGEDEKELINKLNILKIILKNFNKNNQFQQLGPSPAIISKIKKQYRWKIIIKGFDEEEVKNYVIYCINKLKEKENLDNITINLSLNPNFIP